MTDAALVSSTHWEGSEDSREVIPSETMADDDSDGSSNDGEMNSEESSLTAKRGSCNRYNRYCGVENLLSLYNVLKRSWFVVEAKAIVKLAIPLFVMLFFHQLLYLVSLAFVGHISGNANELDAASLAISFVNITGVSVISGLATAADTLCSQSYGFKNFKRVGVILQRGLLVQCVACLPIIVLWLNIEPILLLLKQDPCVVRLSSQYAQVYILSLPSIVLLIMLERYLQSQSVVGVFAVIEVVMNIASAVLHSVFIFGAHLGVIGASLAVTISNALAVVMLIGYIRIRGLHKETWGGWSWESLNEWWQFLKLGVPGFLIKCFEWWSFEIGILVTGAIDQTQLAINGILIVLEYVTYMAPLGIGIAASVRVGNELGAGNILRAKRASKTAILLGCGLAVVMVTLLLSLKSVIPRLFTKDEEVHEGMGTAIYGFLLVVLTDQIQAPLTGIMRGSGRQVIGAVTSFFSFYFIGLPVGISLALLANMGAFGIWLGLAVANLVQTAGYLICVLKTNWRKQSEKAMKNASDKNKVTDIGRESENESGGDCELENPVELMQCQEITATVIKSTEDDTGSMDLLPLVSCEDQKVEESSSSLSVKRTRLRLLLTKGIVLIVGLLFLAAGIVVAVLFQNDITESECIADSNDIEISSSGCFGHCSESSSLLLTVMPEPTRTLHLSYVQTPVTTTISS